MAVPDQELRDMYARLVLDEDGDGILEDNGERNTVRDQISKYTLVGKFLTNGIVHFEAMKSMMANVWKPVFGVYITEEDRNLYTFQFANEHDFNRIHQEGPWPFNQKLLLLKKLEPGTLPEQMELSHAEFWVQIHGLPPGFFSEHVARSIGNFIESDSNNFKGTRKAYVRIRVLLNVSKALKRKMRISLAGGAETWANFKYEKLPHFCFLCGIIGHSENFCRKFLLFPDKNIEKLFGPWLRAPSRRNNFVDSDNWILSAPPIYEDESSGQLEAMHVDVADKAGQTSDDGGIMISDKENVNPLIKTKQSDGSSSSKYQR